MDSKSNWKNNNYHKQKDPMLVWVAEQLSDSDNEKQAFVA